MRRNAYETARLNELIEGGRRAAKSVTCRKCGADVLEGDDHDTISTKVRVDVTPISLTEEMQAVAAGLHTFDLAPCLMKSETRGSFKLYHREPWHYHSPTQKYRVLVEHRCRKDDACMTLFSKPG